MMDVEFPEMRMSEIGRIAKREDLSRMMLNGELTMIFTLPSLGKKNIKHPILKTRFK